MNGKTPVTSCKGCWSFDHCALTECLLLQHPSLSTTWAPSKFTLFISSWKAEGVLRKQYPRAFLSWCAALHGLQWFPAIMSRTRYSSQFFTLYIMCRVLSHYSVVSRHSLAYSSQFPVFLPQLSMNNSSHAHLFRDICLRWFPSFALRIPTTHDFCVISARARAYMT